MPQLCFNCFHQHDPESGVCPYCGFDLEQQKKDYPIALTLGTMLNNRYYVGRVLGQGGFGITYVALDTNLNAKVAIKEFMPSELATRLDGRTVSVYAGDKSQEFDYGQERFLEEARTLAQFIGNPNIAGVSNYFTENVTSYFVMDYIEGVSFKDYIANQGGQVSLEDALNVMIPVLNALSAVHQAGFIHRDVTPDNIFITKDGGVKLLDFGSARYSIGDKSKSLDVILKVGYAPKEQYIRRGRQGPFTDVYSCAACLYACLTGYLPPESLERMEEDTLTPVSQVLPEIPQYINNAILKGLAVNAEDRFQSAQEFLQAIETQTVVQVPVKEAPAPEKKKSPAVMIAAIAGVVVLGCVMMFAFGGNSSVAPVQPSTNTQSVQTTQVAQDNAPNSITITIGDDQVEVGNGYLVYEGYVGDAEFAQICAASGIEQIYLQNADARDLTDISPVASLENLTTLVFGEVPSLTSLEGLGENPNLTELQFSSQSIESLDGIEGATGLTCLRIFGNSQGTTSLEDFSALSSLTNLQTLYITTYTSVVDLSPLANLTTLESIDIQNNKTLEVPVDVTPLAGLVNLTRLNLFSGIGDLTALSNLTNLTFLELSGGHSLPSNLQDFSSVEPLANLTKLETLHLNSGELTSVDALSNLTNLTELTLYCSKLTSLSPLSSLVNLEELVIYYGAYTDLSPLSNLTNLYSVDISSTNVTLENKDALDHVKYVEIRDNTN